MQWASSCVPQVSLDARGYSTTALSFWILSVLVDTLLIAMYGEPCDPRQLLPIDFYCLYSFCQALNCMGLAHVKYTVFQKN